MVRAGSTAVPYAGRWLGRAQVGEFFAAVGRSAEVQQFGPTEFLGDGDRVAVLGHGRVRSKSTGRTYDADWRHIWTLRDGKITAFREFIDTTAVNGAS